MGDSMGGCSVGRISNTGMDLTIKSRYGIRLVETVVVSAVVLAAQLSFRRLTFLLPKYF